MRRFEPQPCATASSARRMDRPSLPLRISVPNAAKIGNLIVFPWCFRLNGGGQTYGEEAKGAVLSLLMDAYRSGIKWLLSLSRPTGESPVGTHGERWSRPTGGWRSCPRGRTPLASGLEGKAIASSGTSFVKRSTTRLFCLSFPMEKRDAAPEGMKLCPLALEAARLLPPMDALIRGDRCGQQGLVQFAMARRFLKAWKPNICILKNSRRIRWCVRSGYIVNRILKRDGSPFLFWRCVRRLGHKVRKPSLQFLGEEVSIFPFRFAESCRSPLPASECIGLWREYGHAGRNHGAHEDPKAQFPEVARLCQAARARLHAEFRSDHELRPDVILAWKTNPGRNWNGSWNLLGIIPY